MTADVDAVTAANAELYAAFEEGDVDRMEAIWDDAEDVGCIHPGWPLLRGRARVLRSWSVIMANTNYIQFFLTGVHAVIDTDVAVVTCEENILTAVADPDGGLSQSAKVVSTNVFRRRDDGWRLWLHHGSPVLAPSEEPSSD
ncbi:MAG TPA: nuclear transport factor 2 family protein [Mycobacteriales bacterium]|nr:nuclear transport factor 2 family protein [Mycobacteriales bacterium]